MTLSARSSSVLRGLQRTTTLQPWQHVAQNRLISSSPNRFAIQTESPTRPVQTPPEKQNWLTRRIESSPSTKSVFLKLATLMGYNSPRQLAGRRAFVLYSNLCASSPDFDASYWQNECFLPPTFQSWFTVTNLHIWMLSVRLRALPAEYDGKAYVQALLDHFFIDIEDRVRAILQPPAPGHAGEPYTHISGFYANPNAQHAGKRGSKAPDRIVNRQMKIFKEQWAGMGISCDLGLVQGDQELAAAIWRNILGARGAQGITYSVEDGEQAGVPFRRAVNLVGGEVVNVAKIDLEKEETTDDGSGVHDFSPSEVDNYLTYPERMLEIVTYVRREIDRLGKLSDEDIVSGDWEKLTFGRVVGKQK